MFRIEERVRFSDIDGMGHVNNAVFMSYMETARTEYYMELTGRRTLQEMGFILARIACDFHSPLFLGETVIVEVWPTRIGNTSFDVGYRLLEKGSGRLIAEGVSVQVCYDYAKRVKQPLPPELRSRLEAELR
jgi:acyl-CoA thioester hydrolase